MSRYAIQWILFVVFCLINAWLWFGDRLPLDRLTHYFESPQTTESTGALKTSLPPPVSSQEETVATDLAASTGQSQETAPLRKPKSTFPDELRRLTNHLQKTEYEKAIELYSSVYTEVSEPESQPYRDLIYTHAETLAARQNHEEAIQLMQQYTDVFYKDLIALRLKARSQHALKYYDQEIASHLSALQEATLEEDIQYFRNALNEAASIQAAFLVDAEDATGAAAMYEDLIASYPGYPPLVIGLSRTLVELGQIERAGEALTALPRDPVYEDQVEGLLTVIDQIRSSGPIAIPVRRIGENYSVDAVINGLQVVTLLIDTGASITTIRPGVLRKAGINLQQPQRSAVFNTANGRVNTPIFRLKSLALSEHVVNDIEVGSIRLDNLDQIDGLLGMNFLNEFQFTLNQQERVILLTR